MAKATTPRPMTDAERQRASRAARAAAGGILVSGVLSAAASRKLRALMARDGTGIIETLNGVLERKRPG